MVKKTYILTVADYSNFDPQDVECVASENKELIEKLRDAMNVFFAELPADYSKDVRAKEFLCEPEYRSKLLDAVLCVVELPDVAEAITDTLCNLCDVCGICVYKENFSICEILSI